MICGRLARLILSASVGGGSRVLAYSEIAAKAFRVVYVQIVPAALAKYVLSVVHRLSSPKMYLRCSFVHLALMLISAVAAAYSSVSIGAKTLGCCARRRITASMHRSKSRRSLACMVWSFMVSHSLPGGGFALKCKT